MGFKNGKIIKNDEFEALELNEGNVRAVFNQCGKSGEDGTTTWDEEALKKARENIRYLLGQLALVHEGATEHELDSAFCRRYDNQAWTDSRSDLIRLLNMGGKSGFVSSLKKDGKQFARLKLDELTPTLSPKDPDFSAWWQTPAALVIQAQAAKNNGKDADALVLYEQAARQGHAEAQYEYGWMYYRGEGTAEDMAKALMWFEKAAEQGHADAQLQCGLFYGQGMGTAKDDAKSLMWLEKAAEQGIAAAQSLCGQTYFIGTGTAIDMKKAKMWLQKAAESTGDSLMDLDARRTAKEFLREYF